MPSQQHKARKLQDLRQQEKQRQQKQAMLRVLLSRRYEPLLSLPSQCPRPSHRFLYNIAQSVVT